MFEVTADDIARLSDEDLRTLVGLLCEAELRERGISTSHVTWSGHQDAADGGIDVRVSLPAESRVEGFIPRPCTGFQVKATAMPPRKIHREIRPSGIVRTAIAELADQAGAYVIVSSEKTTDSALKNRRREMNRAVEDLRNRHGLTLDFYDSGRLATWVRSHAGLMIWVREKTGRAFPGWRLHGPWASIAEEPDAEYLLDYKIRIRGGTIETADGLNAHDGIRHIRRFLRHPRVAVRLVGPSGVGKTRLAQALFDDRIGDSILDPAHAIYTNMADSPDPSPSSLATNLIASRFRAILVIDNCGSDLHRRLADLCRSSDSTVSLMTIEYDIAEDQPEETEVFRLEPSSDDLIGHLVKRRFPEVSDVNATTIMRLSNGNARIALALAATVGRRETLTGLNDKELFDRLIYQRQGRDQSLYRAAQACSLVYSFQGEDVSDGCQAELARLGALVDLSANEMHRAVAEMYRRGIVQRRSVWRAVMPQVLANHLAARAIEDVPDAVLEAELVNRAPRRLLLSFARRLGYLDTSPEAVKIVKQWLRADGLIGRLTALDDFGMSILSNVAPTAPDGFAHQNWPLSII